MDLICIDMDNTLIDSDKSHILAYQFAFKKKKLRFVSAKELKKLFGLTGHDIIRRLFPRLKEEEIRRITKEHDYFLFKETKKYLKPFNGAKQALRKLKKRYKLALISNCNHKEILVTLKTTNINKRLFDVLIGNEDIKKPKPWPDEILKAQKLVHHKARCIIGDSIYDVRAGKKAGVMTISVLTGNNSRRQLKKEKPDYILRNFKDVTSVL